MDTKAARSASSLPNVPQALKATAGDHDGEIDLSWKAVSNARSYTIESSVDPATASSWTHVGIATSTSKTIANLKSGKRYWFRLGRNRRWRSKRLERTRHESRALSDK